jgi:beta-galactosidase
MHSLSDFTRRDFLKSATALSAAALVVKSSLAKTLPPLSQANDQNTSSSLVTGWEYRRGALGSAWDVWREDFGNSIKWQSVRLPHSFNANDAVDPDGTFYEGPGWYRCKVQVVNPFDAGRSILHFEGAGPKTEVFVGLEKVGQHSGGYDEFSIDISDCAAKTLKHPHSNSEVAIAVLCDNSRDSETVPSSLNDFHRYGGLYRQLSLVYVPALSLQRIHIDSKLGSRSRAVVAVRGRLYNPMLLGGTLQIRTRVLDPKGTIIYSSEVSSVVWTGDQKIASFEVNDPQLWSPSSPVLYRCEITLTSDHGVMVVTDRFGFRYFEFLPHGPFHLNGERFLLRGTQREEDHCGVGPAMSEDLIRRELSLIKDMGANFLGLAHHQQSRRVLELCDELGLLVLEEVPWSRGGLGGENYKQQVRAMLHAMIDQHYNHPSVIVWGLGNENDWPGDFPEFDREKIRAFVKELNDQAHAFDPTRKTFIRRCDFCKDIVDVYSPSIWAGWYHGPYTNYRPVSEREMGKVSHFLHLEWGAESHARRHAEDPDRFLAMLATGELNGHSADYLLSGGQEKASETGDWSETYACNLFDWHLKEQESMPWLTGTAHWIFKDFSTPVRAGNPVPFVNQKGLAERDLTLKEGYYVFQSYWTESPMIHLYGHSWAIRWGSPDELKMVKVYSNCDTAELFVNEISCGEKKRNPRDFPAAGLHWLVQFSPGENHLRAVGHRAGRTVTDDIRLNYQTKKWGTPSRFELRELDRDSETVRVQASLVDGSSIRCLDARNRVRFGLAGDGRLIDNLGTSGGSRIIELYNGCADMRVRTSDGKSVLSVSAAGIPSAFLAVG